MRFAALGLAAGMIFSGYSAAVAQDLKVSGTKIGVALKGHTNLTLSVSGPKRFQMQSFAKRGSVSLDIAEHVRPPDGDYSYQITAASRDDVEDLSRLDNGRDEDAGRLKAESVIDGMFRVVKGTILMPKKANGKSDKDEG